MQFIKQIIPEQITEALGWTILHSLWQGALIVLLMGGLLIVFRKKSAKFRYKLAFSGMLTMFAAAVVTFILNWPAITTLETVESSPEWKALSIGLIQDVLNGSEQSLKAGIWDTLYMNTRSYFDQNIPLFVTTWMMGLLLMSLRFMGGLVLSQRIRHYRTLGLDGDIKLKIYELADKLELDKRFEIIGSEFARIPMVTGWLRPVLIIPVSLFIQLPYEQIEAILVHELAHIRRNDYLQNIVQSIIELLFFYHPAIWWMSAILRQEREHICDDAAIGFTKDPLLYARSLASLQE
ncbi:MAG: M56 family metallopeptidase, partial [Bacteroidales bacterium]|nr:M56 family metallopeptidase [Bacteroidales bacterium]